MRALVKKQCFLNRGDTRRSKKHFFFRLVFDIEGDFPKMRGRGKGGIEFYQLTYTAASRASDGGDAAFPLQGDPKWGTHILSPYVACMH